VASYASDNDVVGCVTNTGEVKDVSQVEVSRVVQSRVDEILKLAKNEIKNLTKREIRYIIVTGGLSELSGFQYMVDNVFELKAKVCNIDIMGIRHNKYSSALGVVKYFDDKLALRGKSLSMVSESDKNNLISTGKKVVTNDNIVNKVFGHFFDN
jgi:cell division protein FtsA